MAEFTDKFSSFTMTQLNELLEDDEKLNSIVKEMNEMCEVQQVKELTLVSNISLAEQNLQLQPSLDLQKNQLTSRYRHLQELYDNYQLRKSTLCKTAKQVHTTKSTLCKSPSKSTLDETPS
ncbi:vacuolar protein sorting-associated protein 37B-like [Oncorhynchus keta]|uniref:vacuolar protein sorting-associated protein 37B-like n=1 Tax=Oncorhynchus keta TaxID=8018 RepID=UPI00227BAB8C|nr:vacuolar protein sorting-associated protein 37B-like [Oncorhynchus keta]